MRHKKPFTIPSITLAALIGLLVASGGLASTQSPVPATKPAAAAIAPTATTPTAASAADEDIRDIRPPIHIPYGWLWAAYVAGGLALAGLTFAAWRWHQRYRQSRRKLLYELTLEELEAARALMQPLKGYQFSIAVSEIIRKYIEQQFHARAAHRTTEEFLHDLLTQSNTALAAHQPLLAEFLEHCDLAKFARWQHSVPQMQAMHHSACTFVVQTGKPAAPSVTESVTVAPLPMLIQPRST
jgi:hypothetical protein